MLILAAAKWMPPWQLPLFWSLNVEGSCGSFVLLAQLLGLRGGMGFQWPALQPPPEGGRPFLPGFLHPLLTPRCLRPTLQLKRSLLPRER